MTYFLQEVNRWDLDYFCGFLVFGLNIGRFSNGYSLLNGFIDLVDLIVFIKDVVEIALSCLEETFLVYHVLPVR